MKCLCGYETGHDFEKNEKLGDDAFIQLSKVVKSTDRERDKVVTLYACPKCNTVQIAD